MISIRMDRLPDVLSQIKNGSMVIDSDDLNHKSIEYAFDLIRTILDGYPMGLFAVTRTKTSKGVEELVVDGANRMMNLYNIFSESYIKIGYNLDLDLCTTQEGERIVPLSIMLDDAAFSLATQGKSRVDINRLRSLRFSICDYVLPIAFMRETRAGSIRDWRSR